MTRKELDTYVRTARHLLARVPAGHRLCVVEEELVLVPDDLAHRSPHDLNARERTRVKKLSDVGLSEAA